MKKTLQLILGTIAIFITIFYATAFFGDGPQSQAASTPGPHPVFTSDVLRTPASRPRVFHGVTRAIDRAVLSFPLGGRLVSRPVELGQRLRAGDTIGALDASPFRHNVEAQAAAVAEVQERLTQLERNRRRTARLVQAGALPTHDLEMLSSNAAALEARLSSVQAQLREARRTRRDAVLRAPFDGVIVELTAEPGELVGPGSPVAVLAGGGALEIEIEVPESLAGQLSEGDPVRIDLPLAQRQNLPGIIRDVGGSIGQPGRLFPLVVTLNEELAQGVQPGMTADVTLHQPLEPALTVPVGAVVNPTGEKATVFVVREDRAQRVEVTPGLMMDGRVTVRGELRAGESVVVGGQVGLVEGSSVEVHQ